MPVIFQEYSVASSKVVFIRAPSPLSLILVNALSVKHIMESSAFCTNEKVTSTDVCST